MKQRNMPEELMFLRNRKLPPKTTDASMHGKLCIITGATSGVGLEASKKLASLGATIVMVARNEAKANQVKAAICAQYPVSIEIIVADFSDLNSVKAAAEKILSNYPKIDVLIQSAGLHSTKKQYTSQGFELVFCVNHLSSYLFTHLLLPRLKQSAPSKILYINSEGHRFNGLRLADLAWKQRIYSGLRGYGASKTAQLLCMWELDDQLVDSGVVVNAMHPGDVKTSIGSNNGWFYRLFFKYVISRYLKEPSISGESIAYLVADPQMEGISGRYFYLTTVETPAKHALDRNRSKEMDRLTKELIQEYL